MGKLFEYDEHIGDWRVLVQSRDIQNGAVQSMHIAPGVVTNDKIDDNAIQSRHIAPEAVTSDNIDDKAIKSRHIAPWAVTNDKIAPGAIDDVRSMFKDLLDNYEPIVINGDVTNAPDEEDITSADGLLKLKNRNSVLSKKGYTILRRGTSIGEQLNLINTIYEVKYDFVIYDGIIDAKVLVFNSSQVSTVKTPEKVALDNATTAYNEAVIEYNVAAAAYEEDPTEENLAAKNEALAAKNAAESAKNSAQTKFEAIGSQPYYYWKEVNMEAHHALHLTGRAVRLNDDKTETVPTENGIVCVENAQTVYIGCLEGSFSYRYDNYIRIPDGCQFKFEGGTITGGTILGSIENSYLDVSNFTRNNDITEAIRMILPLTNVFIPKGEWEISSIINLISDRNIFGEDKELSCVTLKGQSQFYVYDVLHASINNLNIKIDPENENYAIRLVAYNRYITLSDLNIHCSSDWNRYASCGGIQVKNIVTQNYSGNVYCVFKHINLYFLKNGIDIDMNVQRSTDYITSSVFNDIHIDRFLDTAFRITGIRCYTCSFTDISISDNWDAGIGEKKGIAFGGFCNHFKNISIWADARNYGHEFYALWIGEELQSAVPSYFEGYVEGNIGGASAWVTWFNRVNYNFIFYRVSSINNSLIHTAKKISNIENTGYFRDILGWKNIINNNSFEIVSGEVSAKWEDGYLSFCKSSNGNFVVRFRNLQTGFVAGYKYRIFALLGIEKDNDGENGYASVRIYSNPGGADYTVSYLMVRNAYNNVLADSNENDSCAESSVAETGVMSYVDIGVTNIKKLTIKELFIVPYTASEEPLLWSLKKKESLYTLPQYKLYYDQRHNFEPPFANNGETVIKAINGRPCIVWKDTSRYINRNGLAAYPELGTTEERPKGLGAEGGVLTTTDDGFPFYDRTIGKPLWAKNIYPNGKVDWIEADGAIASANRSGDSESRPRGWHIYVGFKYFDTELGKPIYAKEIGDSEHGYPVTWVDALGNNVSQGYLKVVSGATEGNVPKFDANGQLVDSGKTAENIPSE